MNSLSRIIYRLNESNANNPANLLVGQTIIVVKYDDSGNQVDTINGTLEEINNSTVVVRDNHTNESRDYQMQGFNTIMNGIEFICIDDNNYRFYVK